MAAIKFHLPVIRGDKFYPLYFEKATQICKPIVIFQRYYFSPISLHFQKTICKQDE